MHLMQDFFRGWNLMEKGILPHAGGWSEQPAYWIQAFDIIGAETAQYYREQTKLLNS